MIKEAIQLLLQRGELDAAFQVQTFERLGKAYIVQGGVHTEIPLPPEPRDHELHDLRDFASFVKGHPQAEVFIDYDEIRAFLDGGERRDKVSMPLITSVRWDDLSNISEHWPAYEPPALQQTLRRMGGVPQDVLDALRTVDFEAVERATYTGASGRESMGRRVEAAAIAGQGVTIPTSWQQPVSVYRTPGCVLPAFVTVELYLDAAKKRVQLGANLDELAGVRADAQSAIQGRLREWVGHERVYLGSP